MSHGGDDEIHEEHEEHVNHEAWVIPYADLLTLLMAMFIALFAMSTVDVTKFKAFAIGFNEALGGGKLDAGVGGTANATSTQVGSRERERSARRRLARARAVRSPTRPSCSRSSSNLASGKAQAAKQRQTLEDVQKEIDDAANKLGLGGDIRTKQLNNGLQVTLLTDKVLFQSGQATLQPEGLQLLERDRRGAELDRQLDRHQRVHRQRADRAGRAVPVQPVSVVVPGRRGRRLLRVDRPRPRRGCSRRAR